MKVTFQLTLDGLVRALRSEVHGLTERVEAGFRDEAPEAMKAGGGRVRRREGEDERSP